MEEEENAETEKEEEEDASEVQIGDGQTMTWDIRQNKGPLTCSD